MIVSELVAQLLLMPQDVIVLCAGDDREALVNVAEVRRYGGEDESSGDGAPFVVIERV